MKVYPCICANCKWWVPRVDARNDDALENMIEGE